MGAQGRVRQRARGIAGSSRGDEGREEEWGWGDMWEEAISSEQA